MQEAPRRRLFPASATEDVPVIATSRAIRGFADGFVSVLLARYLVRLGYSPVEIGAIVTGTLLGSAVLTIAFGFLGRRIALRSLLLAAAVLMLLTGIGFASVTWFAPLLAIAVLGTLNPSAGDVSVFLPTEQAYIAGEVDARDRPRVYAVYNVAGTLAGAIGALASGLPEPIGRALGWSAVVADRATFVLYAAVAFVVFALYRRLRRPDLEAPTAEEPPTTTSTRRVILELAALFSLDSAGSGFVVTSLLVLWLRLRFGLSAAVTAEVFFAAGLLGACSQFLAPRLAARIGLIRTMVFTHIPANVLLAAAAFAPNGGVAIALLLTRALFAQMDVPARQSFVMAMVPPRERSTASSITNVPRSFASALTPLLAGALLARTTFGWPLVIAGGMKISYDLILLARYRHTPEGGR